MNQKSRTNAAGETEAGEQLDSKIIPVMREAVVTVQLILFSQLKKKMEGDYSDWEPETFRRLVGCIVNDLFGNIARDKESLEFARKHLDVIEKELHTIADNVPEMLPYLTDALRMQTLCDHEEGANTLPTLLRARAVGVLQEERALPMPSTFMIFVRQLGSMHGLLKPVQVSDPDAE